jgi:ribosome-associated protein
VRRAQIEPPVGLESSPVADALAGRWAYVLYENGLPVNVLYIVENSGKRAAGCKLPDGMGVPAELASFTFARQKPTLAGTIRGSYFVVQNGYRHPRPGSQRHNGGMREIATSDGSIRLGQFLKLANVAESGADARSLLEDGRVQVNGEAEDRRGRQLVRGDVVTVGGTELRVG